MKIFLLTLFSIWMMHFISIEGMQNENYSDIKFVSARARWLGQESLINQLWCDATMHACNIPHCPTVFFLNQRYFIKIDAFTGMIKTFIENGDSVDLNYEEFSKFLTDADLLKKARTYSIN